VFPNHVGLRNLNLPHLQALTELVESIPLDLALGDPPLPANTPEILLKNAEGGVIPKLSGNELRLNQVLSTCLHPLTATEIASLVWPGQEPKPSLAWVTICHIRKKRGPDSIQKTEDGHHFFIPDPAPNPSP
jgi:hypothetical protein